MTEPIDGVVVVDKPVGPTSFDIVHQARTATGAKKVGHGGTLDPLASGVLPICFGEATKLAQFLLDADKEYEATINFGCETDTYDAAGAVTARLPTAHLREEDVRVALTAFVGEQAQVPPMYSALKRQGRPLYRYARAGQTVDREARVVRIYSLELRSFWPGRTATNPAPNLSGPAAADGDPTTGCATDSGTEGAFARVFVRCSKGTYVRSLAYDLGRALGTGGHLGALRRTRSGPFVLEGAISPNLLGAVPLPVVSPAAALAHLPTVAVSVDVALALMQGKVVNWERAGDVVGDQRSKQTGALIRILSPAGDLLAVAPLAVPDAPIRTLRIFRGWEQQQAEPSAAVQDGE